MTRVRIFWAVTCPGVYPAHVKNKTTEFASLLHLRHGESSRLHLHMYEWNPALSNKYLAPDHFQGIPASSMAASWRRSSTRSAAAHMGSDPQNAFHVTGKIGGEIPQKCADRKNVEDRRRAGNQGKDRRAWAGIYDAETDELLAEGTAMHINVPEDQFDKSRLTDLGWNCIRNKFPVTFQVPPAT